VAAEFHAEKKLDPNVREVPARAWLGATASLTQANFLEHAEHIPEPGWGGLLSLLWHAPNGI
jgi:hypothetical protein